jgi:hypothetical protein
LEKSYAIEFTNMKTKESSRFKHPHIVTYISKLIYKSKEKKSSNTIRLHVSHIQHVTIPLSFKHVGF